MLFIRGYYYFFAAFIFAITGIFEGISYLNKLHFTWPRRRRVSFRTAASMLHLGFK